MGLVDHPLFLPGGIAAGSYFLATLIDLFGSEADRDLARGYVKMLSTLTPLQPPQLLVADLATMHLDLAAADRG